MKEDKRKKKKQDAEKQKEKQKKNTPKNYASTCPLVPDLVVLLRLFLLALVLFFLERQLVDLVALLAHLHLGGPGAKSKVAEAPVRLGDHQAQRAQVVAKTGRTDTEREKESVADAKK